MAASVSWKLLPGLAQMPIRLEKYQEFALLTIDRPEALNALSFELIRAIGEAIDRVPELDGVRALLIIGAGDRAFCAGADIKELRNRDLAAQRAGAELGQAVFAKLDRLPLPSIALLNGHAFGGGLELAMACTFRLMVTEAKLGLPEVKLGLIPGYGGTQRLPRLVGLSKALDMVLSGRTVDAAEAVRIGLVNAVVERDVLAAGVDFARTFSGHGLRALQFAREAITRGMTLPLDEGLRLEADLSTLAYRTADAEEGMAAFQEKRKAVFRDV